MNRADCDSERYLGLLDSAERSWKPALGRFSTAASCYEDVIVRLQSELAEYEKDITGLSNGLIAAKRVEIREAEALRDQSILNAAAATQECQVAGSEEQDPAYAYNYWFQVPQRKHTDGSGLDIRTRRARS